MHCRDGPQARTTLSCKSTDISIDIAPFAGTGLDVIKRVT